MYRQGVVKAMPDHHGNDVDGVGPPTKPAEPTAPLNSPSGHDSATSRAENHERNDPTGHARPSDDFGASPTKRIRIDNVGPPPATSPLPETGGVRGVAQVKKEFLLQPSGNGHSAHPAADDDAAEASHHVDDRDHRSSGRDRKKQNGQNKSRSFGSSRDALQLCASRATQPEFSPGECRFGADCKFEHDLRRYLREGKRRDLATFGGLCPVWDAQGRCNQGWKCRFVGSHMEEKDTEGGRKELFLTEDVGRKQRHQQDSSEGIGVVNVVGAQQKIDLMKRKLKMEKSEEYVEWLGTNAKDIEEQLRLKKADPSAFVHEDEQPDTNNAEQKTESIRDNAAMYTKPPLLPSEKRRVYFGAETPVLAPLTTQGNLPFRRLCVDLGAQLTYSEMAMSVPLIQGNKAEWALLKAHETEIVPPKFLGKGSTVPGYEHSKDLKFGAQIAGNKPWSALKATETLTKLCPHLRVIDLNCGCPIDLVYRTGAGSALLDQQSKLEKMVRGMNVVSGEVPITVKIRMGTKAGHPTALKLVERLALGGRDAMECGAGACGVAAVTLHGRSRQQRYAKSADWGYISECAALINRFSRERDAVADTIRESDPRSLSSAPGGKVYFLGNGDCYSHADYYSHLEEAKVDSVMVARGALIKPWIFEEIEKKQYLDKSASERLQYVEKFARYGLETWGSDEVGVGTTRRFLLEWLSFAHRYVPLGILEHLPPHIQDRPPAWKGRNDLENLLGSENYKDWIKISEMFLGPAHRDFRFEPKHKSNSYEIEAEG